MSIFCSAVNGCWIGCGCGGNVSFGETVASGSLFDGSFSVCIGVECWISSFVWGTDGNVVCKLISVIVVVVIGSYDND